jgi:hypothetical protein
MEAFPAMRGILNNFEAYLRLFMRVEAFDYKFEAFLKITRLFDDIFREIEALIRKMKFFLKDSKLFEDIFNEIEDILK